MKFKQNTKTIIRDCLEVVARNFCYLRRPNFSTLPYDIFLTLLQHKSLAVRQVIKTVSPTKMKSTVIRNDMIKHQTSTIKKITSFFYFVNPRNIGYIK
jgi:hypothetical protein